MLTILSITNRLSTIISIQAMLWAKRMSSRSTSTLLTKTPPIQCSYVKALVSLWMDTPPSSPPMMESILRSYKSCYLAPLYNLNEFWCAKRFADYHRGSQVYPQEELIGISQTRRYISEQAGNTHSVLGFMPLNRERVWKLDFIKLLNRIESSFTSTDHMLTKRSSATHLILR